MTEHERLAAMNEKVVTVSSWFNVAIRATERAIADIIASNPRITPEEIADLRRRQAEIVADAKENPI